MQHRAKAKTKRVELPFLFREGEKKKNTTQTKADEDKNGISVLH